MDSPYARNRGCHKDGTRWNRTHQHRHAAQDGREEWQRESYSRLQCGLPVNSDCALDGAVGRPRETHLPGTVVTKFPARRFQTQAAASVDTDTDTASPTTSLHRGLTKLRVTIPSMALPARGSTRSATSWATAIYHRRPLRLGAGWCGPLSRGTRRRSTASSTCWERNDGHDPRGQCRCNQLFSATLAEFRSWSRLVVTFGHAELQQFSHLCGGSLPCELFGAGLCLRKVFK